MSRLHDELLQKQQLTKGFLSFLKPYITHIYNKSKIRHSVKNIVGIIPILRRWCILCVNHTQETPCVRGQKYTKINQIFQE